MAEGVRHCRRPASGEPVVLRTDAAGMHATGYDFFLADIGVWLTEHVPPQWIVE